ncbi:GAF domain-containing protein [Stakelama pacifica]|uniref:GAF domain-containing protein n=1 Tax=Stakelama pacifica TaxID=517720 RepID=A0A4R6FXI8_9SPHN|nr:GAF domain-containing protein [Stakelama pacifica]TDN86663.1 GAF domain-containing protein [Stakelama pacifica]GGO90314.1 hypothetical protein GCM10011329_02330 [Stakelama pacifica]
MSGEDTQRLEALRSYGVLDTPNEAEFDAIVEQAAREIGVPIALISLIDEDRQWFKAKLGLEPRETPRNISFCTHAIRGDGVMTVEDATLDQRFSKNPLVTDDPGIRFYAGAPLTTPNGRRIGTLCVIDRKPRLRLSAEQEALLTRLAAQTIEAMERRKLRNAPKA